MSEWMVKTQIPWQSFIIYVEIAETGVFEGIDRGVCHGVLYNRYVSDTTQCCTYGLHTICILLVMPTIQKFNIKTSLLHQY